MAHAEDGDETDCMLLRDPIYSSVRPTRETQLITPWLAEADRAAARYAYTEDRGVIFRAALNLANGPESLRPVHRLANYRAADFRYSLDPAEIQSAVAAGYVDQGSRFSASTTAEASCVSAVKQYVKNGKHRLAATASEQAKLLEGGWTYDRVSFYAAPADGSDVEPSEPDDGDKTFSFAVMPDTQQEVLRANDSRFLSRTTWLATQKSTLDLRWVTHSGDVVNWDTPDHSQYAVADRAMEPLKQANIPYSLAIGNHDTAAVCPGGAACDPTRTRTLFRDTRTFNSYFSSDEFGLDGVYEAGKVDNGYVTYSAGGLDWMLLRLEMWPRAGAVAWAKKAVAEHPRHNVIIVTHNYLDENGRLDGAGGYGDTTPEALYNQLISQYSNIRMVFSGHVGSTASRVDTGVNGNKIYSFLQTIHSTTANPVRLVEVDTDEDTLRTWVYSPYTRQNYPEWTRTFNDIDWVD